MPIIDPIIPKLTKRRLFASKVGSPHVFTLASRRRDWHRYAIAYKLSADAEVDRLMAGDMVGDDAACLPALFLYRHWVELSLKGMLADAGVVLDLDDVVPAWHPLVPLWEKLRGHYKVIDSKAADDEWMDRTEELIAEMDSLDSSSFTFRYPVDKRGAPAISGPRRMDVEHLKDVMEEFEMVLDGIASQLIEYVGYKRDMEREIGAW